LCIYNNMQQHKRQQQSQEYAKNSAIVCAVILAQFLVCLAVYVVH
jgi:formate/nitrite transporter FocA (FNT family)